jgi:HAD superfamily hydrolase (TIGR01490 family)
MALPTLALFDLDHTLLSGDSDVLWCDFLIAQGLLDAASFGARNAEMEARYKSGVVGAAEFAGFYVSTLSGRSPDFWQPWRERFLGACVLPRLCADARALVRAHHERGDLVVLTTATNRYITELTAAELGIEYLIATECEIADGIFTGHTSGVLNMREGKVTRLHAWLAARGQRLDDFSTVAYSDSINDLPLLQTVRRAVVVDPDASLRAWATTCDWDILEFNR